MVICHMVADTSDELHEMAMRLGLLAQWCQCPGTYKEHYDVARGKKELAIQLGAKEITRTWLAGFLRKKRLLHGR